MPTMTDHQEITRIAETALGWIGDRVLLAQGHCVNVFLDLYCASDDLALRPRELPARRSHRAPTSGRLPPRTADLTLGSGVMHTP
jgi:hypothetical protein